MGYFSMKVTMLLKKEAVPSVRLKSYCRDSESQGYSVMSLVGCERVFSYILSGWVLSFLRLMVVL